MSVIKDPATYERFERVVLCHGVRHEADLCYRDYIARELPQHELLGDILRERLVYYPAVSREEFVFEGRPQRGRLTDLMATGQMMADLGLDALDPSKDRAMICGSPGMLADFRALLDIRGFKPSMRIGAIGDYVFARAFAEK
jgi:ferredoxin--NADP+ reductase